jgi:hypothetical protein
MGNEATHFSGFFPVFRANVGLAAGKAAVLELLASFLRV